MFAIAEAMEPRTLLSSNPLDTTFGYKGVVTADPLLFANGGATAVHVLSNGDILVGGYGEGNIPHRFGNPSALEAARYLPDGELDTTFGIDGLVYIPVTSLGQLTGMAVTPTGDIILAGAAYSNDTIIARLTPNGVLDPSFGIGGICTTNWGPGTGGYLNTNAYLYGANVISIALGNDGSIYFGGTNYNTNGTTSFSMLKVNAAGKHSSIFTYPINVYSGASSIVYSAGTLVLGGFSSAGAPGSTTDTSEFTLLGVNTSGTIDQSFGSKGIVRTSIEVTSDIEGLALSPNGDIVAVGNSLNNGSEMYSYGGGSILSDIALVRYTPSGALDRTFGTSGVAVTFGGDTSVVGRQDGLESVTTPSVAVEADGSIAVAGNILAGDEGQFLAIHYGVTGNLLASGAFDVTSEVAPESFFAVAVEGSNIFADGIVDWESSPIPGNSSDLVLAKFNPDMTLSSDFAVDQSSSIPRSIDSGEFLSSNIVVGNPDGYIAGVDINAVDIKTAQAPNGQILMLGPGYSSTTYNGSLTINVDLARYNADGTRDLSLKALSDVAGSAITVQSNGKILIAGDPTFGFQRLNDDGSVDTSFNPTGPSLVGASSIVELPDDDLLVAVDSDVYRFLPNGTFDTTFGISGVATNADLSASAMAVESNGTIVVIGGDTVECFTPAGLIDTAFNTTGQLTLSDTDQDTDLASVVLIDSHGNILVGGADQIVALSPNGSLNPQFGAAGVAVIPNASSSDEDPYDPFVIVALALDPQGNVLVGGSAFYSPAGYQQLSRLTPAGQFDLSFGNGGSTVVSPLPSGGDDAFVTGIFTNAQGKIYLAGAVDVSGGDDFDAVTLARFNDGTSISGTVFNDANGDGKQETGEAGIAGRTVYADLNNNGKLDPGEPYAVTNAKGQYTLTDLPAGALLIRQVLPAGQRESTPAYGGAFHVTLGISPLTNINFGSTSTIYISGEVFNDANGNGKLDAGETGLANVRIYIDLANTGSYVPSDDPSVITNSAGDFVFTGLAAATYILRIVPTTGYTQTDPADNGYELVALPSGGVKMNLLLGEKKIA